MSDRIVNEENYTFGEFSVNFPLNTRARVADQLFHRVFNSRINVFLSEHFYCLFSKVRLGGAGLLTHGYIYRKRGFAKLCFFITMHVSNSIITVI